MLNFGCQTKSRRVTDGRQSLCTRRGRHRRRHAAVTRSLTTRRQNVLRQSAPRLGALCVTFPAPLLSTERGFFSAVRFPPPVTSTI
jgi:hypothetical protein